MSIINREKNICVLFWFGLTAFVESKGVVTQLNAWLAISENIKQGRRF